MSQIQIVETVTGATQAELLSGREGATAGDLIELRVDGVADLDVARAVAGCPRPAIVTCRPTWEGGQWHGDEATRRRIFADAIGAGAAFVDIERRAGWLPDTRGTDTKVIVSDHDFAGIPGDLLTRLAHMRGNGADVVKVAVHVRTAADALRLADLLGRPDPTARTVVIGLGEGGYLTRLLPGRFGSAWTYAGSAAPGQMPARWLRDSYRVSSVTPATRLFGVAGAPIAHSASPAIHNAAFHAAGIDARYVPVLAQTVAEAHEVATRLGLEGLSVTAPLKAGWLTRPGVTARDEAVARLGVVNTLRFDGATAEARNFDVAGFLQALKARVVSLTGTRALVLGAGGAARAAVWALQREGVSVTVSARTVAAAERLASDLACTTADWPPSGQWDILVNATPCGTWPAVDESPVSLRTLRAGVVYDLVYNPDTTQLLREAAQAGATTIGGLDMLVAQAALQWEWWIGRAPDVAVMRAAAERFIAEQRAQDRRTQ